MSEWTVFQFFSVLFHEQSHAPVTFACHVAALVDLLLCGWGDHAAPLLIGLHLEGVLHTVPSTLSHQTLLVFPKGPQLAGL